MRRKLLSIVILIFSTFLFADGVQPTGSGTEADPYQVEILDNLLWVSTNNVSWNNHFIQTNDIDASDTQNWNSNRGIFPIGHSYTAFTGKYDGQNYYIDSLYCNWYILAPEEGENIGLFGYTDSGAIIENLRLTNIFVSGIAFVGSVVGYSRYTTINNCYSSGNMSGTQYIGGIVGYAHFDTTISNCITDCYVSGNGNLGGLIGSTYYAGVINNCYSFGNVEGIYAKIGGLIGTTNQGEVIEKCYSTGNVEGNSRIGGLIGHNTDTSVENCYSICNVEGISEMGGLIGRNLDSYVDNCFSSGNVIGNEDAGGLVGTAYGNSAANNSFWDIETSGQTTSAGGTGKSSAEMKDVSTYTALSTPGLDFPWDFVGNPFDDIGNYDIWDIDEGNNDGYPFLVNAHVGIKNEEIIATNEESSLLGNYPNPFNPTTTINFSIQNDSRIDLIIYNIKGQKIKTLTHNDFIKGLHSITWNGRDDLNNFAGSGIYLYKLKVNSKIVAVRKCLLLK